jgi:hypothetical protein
VHHHQVSPSRPMRCGSAPAHALPHTHTRLGTHRSDWRGRRRKQRMRKDGTGPLG